jgi:hypothetical protein
MGDVSSKRTDYCARRDDMVSIVGSEGYADLDLQMEEKGEQTKKGIYKNEIICVVHF